MSPTSPSRSKLVAASAQALEELWDDDGVRPPEPERRKHVEAVADLLEANLSNGRWRRAVGTAPSSGPNGSAVHRYARRVVAHYWTEHERVEGLRARERDLWDELHRQLRGSAYHTLRTRLGVSQPVAFEQANDCAQRACELIFRGRYPFDVSFQAWAMRVLLNCVLAREGRSTDLLDRGQFVEPAPADAEEPGTSAAEGHGQGQDLRRWEDRDALWDAIQRLSSRAQQQVIILGFWHGRSSAEIAQELGRSTQAVYNLRHRALTSLREILGPERDRF